MGGGSEGNVRVGGDGGGAGELFFSKNISCSKRYNLDEIYFKFCRRKF